MNLWKSLYYNDVLYSNVDIDTIHQYMKSTFVSLSLLFNGIYIHENVNSNKNETIWKVYLPEYIIDIQAKLNISEFDENKAKFIEVLWEVLVTETSIPTINQTKILEYIYSILQEECKRMAMFVDLKQH
jgi:hypothetical protein